MAGILSALPGIIIILLIDAAAAAVWLVWLRSKERSFPRFRSPRWFYPFFVLGVLSGFVAWMIEDSTLSEYYTSPALGSAGVVVYYVLFIAIVEEGVKFAVYAFLSRKLVTIREPFDAAIGGATVGLGFAIMENVVYGFRMGPGVSFMRSFVTIQAHMLYSAIPALCFSITVLDRTLMHQKGRVGLAAFGFVLAILLHGLDNTMLSYGNLGGLALILNIMYLGLLSALVTRTGNASPYRTFPWSDWKHALTVIKRGLDVDPENPNLLFRGGLYNLAAGRWVDACVAFDGVVETGKRLDLARSFYAVALFANGDREAAELLFGEHWPGLSMRERTHFSRSLDRAMPSRAILRGEIRDLTRKAAWLPGRKVRRG